MVESSTIDAPKTKDWSAKLDEFGTGKRPLIVTETRFRDAVSGGAQHSLRGSARRAGPGSGLRWSAPTTCVITVEAVKKIEEWLA